MLSCAADTVPIATLLLPLGVWLGGAAGEVMLEMIARCAIAEDRPVPATACVGDKIAGGKAGICAAESAAEVTVLRVCGVNFRAIARRECLLEAGVSGLRAVA